MKKLGFLLLLVMLSQLVVSAQAQNIPQLSDLEAGGWTQIPVSEGICLYGDEYSFFVRPADEPTDNLLVYFQGGGACWDGLTCGSIGQFASFYNVSSGAVVNYRNGIFDFDNPDNPVRDYNFVFLPYCSGDVHGGDNQLTFDVPEEADADFDTIDVYFNGFENTQGVLEWVYDNVPRPEQVVVTGCSAGGYGAITHAPFIMAHYADVPAAVIADSSHGVLPPSWQGLITWNVLDVLPPFIEAVTELDIDTYSTTQLMQRSAQYFPQNQFGQFNSYLDGVQIGFFGTLLGYDLSFENEIVTVASQWTAQFMSNMRTLSRAENISMYTAGGSRHCVVNNDAFYEYDQSGVVFSEWFADVIAGSGRDVSCSLLGQACFNEPTAD